VRVNGDSQKTAGRSGSASSTISTMAYPPKNNILRASLHSASRVPSPNHRVVKIHTLGEFHNQLKVMFIFRPHESTPIPASLSREEPINANVHPNDGSVFNGLLGSVIVLRSCNITANRRGKNKTAVKPRVPPFLPPSTVDRLFSGFLLHPFPLFSFARRANLSMCPRCALNSVVILSEAAGVRDLMVGVTETR